MIVCHTWFTAYLNTVKDFRDLILMMFFRVQVLFQRVISDDILTTVSLEKVL
jgi:hypothetical protein